MCRVVKRANKPQLTTGSCNSNIVKPHNKEQHGNWDAYCSGWLKPASISTSSRRDCIIYLLFAYHLLWDGNFLVVFLRKRATTEQMIQLLQIMKAQGHFTFSLKCCIHWCLLLRLRLHFALPLHSFPMLHFLCSFS